MGGFPTSLSALAIIISLMPGVTFLVGIYLHPKMTRETVQISTPLGIATIIIVSIIVQMLLMYLVLVPACADSVADYCKIPLTGSDHKITLTVEGAWKLYATFLAASVVTGMIGFIWSHLGVRRVTRMPFSSSWAAHYLHAKNTPIAHVATSVAGLDSPILYTGFLSDLRLDPSGKIVSVTLIAASRSVIRLTRVGPIVTPDRDSTASLASLDLVIEGERIQNIAITSQDAILPKNVDEKRLAMVLLVILALAGFAAYSAP